MRLYTYKKGFTLIELLVVIAIIGTLASVVLASLNVAKEKANNTKRISDMDQIRNALQLYWLDNNAKYPPHDSGLQVESSLTELKDGGYLSTLPSDPTRTGNQNYRYCRPDSAANVANPESSFTLRVRPEGTGSAWCVIRHQAQVINNNNSGGNNICWVQPDDTPVDGWCDDEM